MKEELKCLMKRSFDRFVDSDLEIIRANVNERTLCGRLSIHMHCLLHEYDCLKGYYVDVEYNRKHGPGDYYVDVGYNRKQGEIKTISYEDGEIVKITSDIILHSRGEPVKLHNGPVQLHNLIAIEMKKSTQSKESKNEDRKRLEALTKSSLDGKTHPEHVCDYQLGFYIELNISSHKFLFERYEQGQKRDKWHRSF